MKKPWKITLIAAAVAAVVILAAALSVAPLAKRYIERHDRELLGRSIRMDRLRINLFTGRLRAEGLSIGAAGDTATFFRLDSFDMRLRLWPLLGRRIDVRRLHFTAPDLKLYQRGSTFNFDDILARFASDTTAVQTPAEPSEPWEIAIYDIAIRRGHIFYKDLLLDATWGLNDVNLTIPGVYFSGEKTDVGAVLEFAEGGSLATEVAYDIATSAFDIGMKLNGFDLASTQPYFRQSLDVKGVGGRLWADVRLKGNAEHLLSLRADGTVGLAGFSLRDSRERTVAGIDTLGVQLAEGDLRSMRFRFGRVYCSGLSALVELTPEGDNLSALLKPSAAQAASGTVPQPATTGPAETASVSAAAATSVTASQSAAAEPAAAALSAAPSLQIADLEIDRGSVVLRDLTLATPFEYHISEIRMRSRDFDPAKHNRLMIDARMQQTGEARLRWDGSLDDIANQSVTLWLTNVALRDFSPYCEHYTAYPLTHGNLTFRSQNVIRNRYLDGTNHLDVFEPKVDNKRKDLKPEMHIPLKLGLYVLKDKKGHVKMDLPVRGSLDSPEFSYRRIVMKAIGNVLLKVVTAPFSFLGGHHDNLEYIALAPTQFAFTSEQYASFDKIAQTLRDKPDMHIVLTQRIDLDRALPAQAAAALRMAYADHLRAAAAADSTALRQPMTLLEYEHIQQTDIRTPEIGAFADSLLTLRGITPTGLSAQAKAVALYRDKALGQLRSLMQVRDKVLGEYMLSTHGLATPAFSLQTPDSAALAAYRGRDRYTIALEVDGERIEIAPADSTMATGVQGIATHGVAEVEGVSDVKASGAAASEVEASGTANAPAAGAAAPVQTDSATRTHMNATATGTPGETTKPASEQASPAGTDGEASAATATQAPVPADSAATPGNAAAPQDRPDPVPSGA